MTVMNISYNALQCVDDRPCLSAILYVTIKSMKMQDFHGGICFIWLQKPHTCLHDKYIMQP